MKKLVYGFNWCMFIVLLMALCSFDADSWTAEIIAVASGLMLVGGAYMLEQIKLHEEVMEYDK